MSRSQNIMLSRLLPLATLIVGLVACAHRTGQPADLPAAVPAATVPPATVPPGPSLAPEQPAAHPAVSAPSGAASTYNEANLLLGVDLHHQLRSLDLQKNALISPTSIGLAFAMTWAGARGQTAREMEQTLHLPQATDTVPRAAGELLAALNTPLRDGPVLRVVNQLFAQRTQGALLLPEYVALTRDRFRAPVEFVDFAGNPEGSRTRINEWVSGRTENRITELLPAQSIDSSTVLVLTNAVYFLGKWAREFRPENTTLGAFHVAPQVKKSVPLMFQEGRFAHVVGDGLSVVELPYAGEELSMLVFLPAEQDGLERLESRLTAAQISEWIQRLRPGHVELTLPKFEMRYEVTLKDPLSKLGMGRAFSEAADFSGMNGQRDLFIGEAYHQTFIKVDEAGTEAAAATAVVMTRKSAPPPATRIVVDHPFLFAIRDRRTDAILFLGRVVDPRPS